MRYIFAILLFSTSIYVNGQSVGISYRISDASKTDTSVTKTKADTSDIHLRSDEFSPLNILSQRKANEGVYLDGDSTQLSIDNYEGSTQEGFFVDHKRDGDLFSLGISKNIQAITGLNNGQIQFIGNDALQGKVVFGGDGSIGNRHILVGFPLEQRAVFNYFRYDFLPEDGGTEDIYAQFKSDSIFIKPRKSLIIGNATTGQTIEMDSLGNYILNDVKNYADNTAADAATDLPSKGIYTLTGDRTLFIKP